MNVRAGAVVLACLAFAAACSGRKTMLPAPTPPSAAPSDLDPIPTPRPPRPTPLMPGAIAIDSNPQGLSVTINGQAAGVTPLNTAAPFSLNASSIVVHGASADYSISFQSSGTAPSAIYFNAVADDRGTLQSISSTAALSDVALSGAQPSREQMAAMEPPSEYSDSELYVTMSRASRAAAPGRRLFDLPGERELRVVHVTPETLTSTEQALNSREGVIAVSRVARVHLLAAPAIPNDPFFLYQWDLTVVRAPEAWTITQGSPSLQVAVVDTGFDAHHPDLASKVSYAESDKQGVTTTGGAAAQDRVGHGTNVSGIIAAETNNGIGYAGSAPDVALQEYAVFEGLDASGSDIATAIAHAVAHGARVINLSIGSGLFTDTGMYNAIQAALAAGVCVVAATGNQGLSTVEEPAADPGVIAVGASAIDDRNSGSLTGASEYVASYSNYGPLMALVAPGGDPAGSGDTDYLHRVNNLWTSTEGDTSCTILAQDGCGYRGSAGTSMAAPHVSAAAALMLSLNPSLTPDRIVRILRATADDIADPKQSAGRLNLERAVASVAGAPSPAVPHTINFSAIAYTVTAGSNVPVILDVTYPRGAAVGADGAFRIADVPAGAGTFEIGVWYDANGDGAVDSGDYFGRGGPCTRVAVCAGLNLVAHPVGAGFVLQ